MNFKHKTILYLSVVISFFVLYNVFVYLIPILVLVPVLSSPFIMGGFSITVLVFHAWYLFIVYKDAKLRNANENWWVLIFLLPAIGAIIYYFVVVSKKELSPALPEESKVVNCPICGKQASYISQYNRYYCYNCKQYLPK